MSQNVHLPHLREAKPPSSTPRTPIPDLFLLKDRTIIITGAAGFLGSTLATATLQSGADVIALDILPAPPASSWDGVGAAADAHGGKVEYVQCDTTDEGKVKAAFEAFVPSLRWPIRGLVACAGISDNGPAMEFDARRIRRLLDVNVTGTFLVAQAVARETTRVGVGGSMVLVASMSGYVANKAAVQQLARSLAAEWGSRKGVPLIRVNSLSPGYIRTVATAEALEKPGMEEQWVGDNMLYRLSTADEFRAPVLFMLGDGSSFMTGADLRVDGGHCAW
ncbi:short-chain dehydrogenase [Elsinoe ampelina]|uniref:Short-chain dehydrogenase n=1 Tax=Elsinoe ampelina TaxID=302913 RepID=A0A6A6G344_9PEZI|nr:short-chain dehydrogenase [Elsinoe ampelina]